MTQYEFDNQKWYKGIQVHINLDNWTGYVAFVDFEKGNIGVSRTSNFYPFEIFKFHEVTVIGKIQPTALDLIAAEREKQISKGRTPESDEKINFECQLARAASDLAYPYENGGDTLPEPPVPLFWDRENWNRLINKPYKERLIVAGALIAAELDRIISLENRKEGSV